MTNILKPYCIMKSSRTRDWLITFRYMIADKMKYKIAASCDDQKTAIMITQLLNNEHMATRLLFEAGDRLSDLNECDDPDCIQKECVHLLEKISTFVLENNIKRIR